MKSWNRSLEEVIGNADKQKELSDALAKEE
jgi:hypothetical protein